MSVQSAILNFLFIVFPTFSSRGKKLSQMKDHNEGSSWSQFGWDYVHDREEHTEHGCSSHSAVELLSWVCTNRNLQCASLVRKGVMHAPFHLSPHCSLPYLPHGKEMIFCSHVFGKSQKGRPKHSQEYVSKTKKVRVSIWKQGGRVCVPCIELYVPASKESCCPLCPLRLAGHLCKIWGLPSPFQTLELRCTKLPINSQKLCSWWERLLEIEKYSF